MKRITLTAILIFVCVLYSSIHSQSVIVTDDASYTTPANGAALDVKSTSKGFLPPRIALTGSSDVTTISSRTTGLLIYNTSTVSDVSPGYYYWNGTKWLGLVANSATVSLSGDLTPKGRVILPMGEINYFDRVTGSTTTISAQSDGSTNLVAASPPATLSSDLFEFTSPSAGKLKYTGATTRMFHCAVTISCAPLTNNHSFVFGLAKNGVVTTGKIVQKFGNASDVQSTAFHTMQMLSTNDVIELYIGDVYGTGNISIKTLNIFALGM